MSFGINSGGTSDRLSFFDDKHNLQHKQEIPGEVDLAMQKYKTDITKWLKILLYCQIAALVFTLLDYIPLDINLFFWPKRLCRIGSILCCFGLAFAGRRYRIAAIFGTIQFSLTILQSVIFFFLRLLMRQGICGTEDFEAWSQFCAVLNLVGMVASWVYLYQYFRKYW